MPQNLETLPTRDDDDQWLAVIEALFVSFNAQKQGRIEPLARRDAAAAMRLVENGRRRFADVR